MKVILFLIFIFSSLYSKCVLDPAVNITYTLAEINSQGTVVDSCKAPGSYLFLGAEVLEFVDSVPRDDGSCDVTYINWKKGPVCTGCTDEMPDNYGPYPMAFGSCKAWDDLNASEQAQFAPGTKGGAPICGVCAAPLKATCSNDEILNSNNDCVPLQFPAGFPDSTKKGIGKYKKTSNLSPEECVPGTVYETTINYAVIVDYDYGGLYDPEGCMFAVYYCNDGLTWNKNKKTCEVPKDTESSDTVSDFITDTTKEACTSGLWAKSWTYDYCNQPLCYISLDVQDYNLQCNNKYIEYDCTSDYRIKTFKQVSCGEVDKADFSTNDLEITPTTEPPPSTDTNKDINITRDSNVTSKVNTDTNTTVTDYSGVVGIINGSLDNVDKSLGSLISAVGITNQKLSETNNKLGSIDGKLDGIKNGLDDIKNALSPETQSDIDIFESGAGDVLSLGEDVKGYFTSIGNSFNETKTLIDSGFTYTPPSVGACVNPSTSVYGRNIELSICEPLQKFSSIFYLIFTLIFSYLAIRIFFIGLSI